MKPVVFLGFGLVMKKNYNWKICSTKPVDCVGERLFDPNVTMAWFSLGGLSPPDYKPVSFLQKQREMTVQKKKEKLRETDEALQKENTQ